LPAPCSVLREFFRSTAASAVSALPNPTYTISAASERGKHRRSVADGADFGRWASLHAEEYVEGLRTTRPIGLVRRPTGAHSRSLQPKSSRNWLLHEYEQHTRLHEMRLPRESSRPLSLWRRQPLRIPLKCAGESSRKGYSHCPLGKSIRWKQSSRLRGAKSRTRKGINSIRGRFRGIRPLKISKIAFQGFVETQLKMRVLRVQDP